MLFLHSEELSGLCKVWDWDPEYADTLKAMGYGTNLVIIRYCTVRLQYSGVRCGQRVWRQDAGDDERMD